MSGKFGLMSPLGIARHLSDRMPTGKIIWQSDFSKGFGLQNPYSNVSPDIGDVYPSSYFGIPCVNIYSDQGAGIAYKSLGRVLNKRVGFAGLFGICAENTPTLIYFIIHHRTLSGGPHLGATIQLYQPYTANRKLAAQISGVPTWETISTLNADIDPGQLWNASRGVVWNYFKLVVDFERQKYVRFTLNEKIFDIPNIPLFSETAGIDFQELLTEIEYNKVGCVLPITDWIITEDEP